VPKSHNKRMLPECHYAGLAVHGSAIIAQPNQLQSIRKCGRYVAFGLKACE